MGSEEAKMSETFRTRLKRKEALLGTLLTLPSPELAEVLALTGLDWLFVDMEHSTMDAAVAQAILQAVAGRLDCLIRVPLNDEIWIKKALDTGATGIIVPQVNSPEEAQRAVRYSRYPPQGARSVGLARAHGYGTDLLSYLRRANDEVVVVVQAEHIQAVKHIDEIVQIEGIDAVLVGPYDLSNSMGLVGQVEHPEVQAAIERVRQVCQALGMPLGIFSANIERTADLKDQGYNLLAVSTDALLVSQAVKDIIQKLRG
jgi:2-dehydro-3-deoxyglucarate aldolase/4-hydroxy-2-oxoheptanedioate aldolase